MAYKTIKGVSVPNLKSFRPTNTELRAKEGGEFSSMLYGKMGLGRSLAYQYGCCNINAQAAKCRIYSESDWLQETIGTVGIVIKNYRIVGIIVEINL